MQVRVAVTTRVAAALAGACGRRTAARGCGVPLRLVFTYDPYYAPALRRYADGGAGATFSALVLPVLLVTTLFGSDGH